MSLEGLVGESSDFPPDSDFPPSGGKKKGGGRKFPAQSVIIKAVKVATTSDIRIEAKAKEKLKDIVLQSVVQIGKVGQGLVKLQGRKKLMKKDVMFIKSTIAVPFANYSPQSVANKVGKDTMGFSKVGLLKALKKDSGLALVSADSLSLIAEMIMAKLQGLVKSAFEIQKAVTKGKKDPNKYKRTLTEDLLSATLNAVELAVKD